MGGIGGRRGPHPPRLNRADAGVEPPPATRCAAEVGEVDAVLSRPSRVQWGPREACASNPRCGIARITHSILVR